MEVTPPVVLRAAPTSPQRLQRVRAPQAVSQQLFEDAAHRAARRNAVAVLRGVEPTEVGFGRAEKLSLRLPQDDDGRGPRPSALRLAACVEAQRSGGISADAVTDRLVQEKVRREALRLLEPDAASVDYAALESVLDRLGFLPPVSASASPASAAGNDKDSSKRTSWGKASTGRLDLPPSPDRREHRRGKAGQGQGQGQGQDERGAVLTKVREAVDPAGQGQAPVESLLALLDELGSTRRGHSPANCPATCPLAEGLKRRLALNRHVYGGARGGRAGSGSGSAGGGSAVPVSGAPSGGDRSPGGHRAPSESRLDARRRKTDERLERERLEREAAEARECTFAPILVASAPKPRGTEEVRKDGRPRHEQLFAAAAAAEERLGERKREAEAEREKADLELMRPDPRLSLLRPAEIPPQSVFKQPATGYAELARAAGAGVGRRPARARGSCSGSHSSSSSSSSSKRRAADVMAALERQRADVLRETRVDDREPLVCVEVDLGPSGEVEELVLRAGDEVARLAEDFAKSHSLSDGVKRRLQERLQFLLEQYDGRGGQR